MAVTAAPVPHNREKVFVFLAIIGAVLCAWALVELPAALNLIDYEALESKGVWGSLTFKRVPDPLLTHLEPPHAHYKGAGLGGDAEEAFTIPAGERSPYHWDLTYDRNGFRNAIDLGAADTVMIGDSMLEGMTVSDSEVISSMLSSLRGRSVANLGQYGYGPQQEMIVLERWGLALHPKTIVWMFFEGNDLQDFIDYRAIAEHPPTQFDFFLQRSFTRMAWQTAKRIAGKNKPAGDTRSGFIREAGAPADTRVFFTHPANPLTNDELGALDGVVKLLAEANRRAVDQNARFLVVFVPEKFRVYRPFLRFPAESVCATWQLSDLPDRMHRLIGAAMPNAGWVDLTPPLADQTKNGPLPYYADDVHWSPAGHKAAAGGIQSYLKEARW